MSIEIIVIGIILIIGFLFLSYLILHSRRSDELIDILKILQSSTQNDRTTLIQTLQQHTSVLNQRLDKTTSVIASVQKSVGEMSEIGRNMQEIQQLLYAPKLRGTIGEQVLNQLLAQVLPHKSYTLQHIFSSGAVVDAIITTRNGIIPIDAKFPLSSYKKIHHIANNVDKKQHERQFVIDVMKHVDDISRKYILPQENTIDYALMYIPSEAVFYEMVNSEKLLDYANKMRVLPVSPITFYAFIKAVLMSLEGERINSQATEILSLIRAMQKDYEKVEHAVQVLSRHITNSYNALSSLSSSVIRMGQKIEQTTFLDNKPLKHHKIEDREDL